MRAYTRSGASRSEVDRAGEALRRWWMGDSFVLEEEGRRALRTALDYRTEFQVPLTKVVMGLRSAITTEEAEVVVGQRLKRMPTILGKLARFKTMNLSQMQDIGGCRAVLPQAGFSLIDAVRARIRRQTSEVVKENDYIAEPKPTGYRAVHIVVLRDSRLIEIQLRTAPQHRWAEAVEQLGGRIGHDLKNGEGPSVLLLFLERAAYLSDVRERGGQPSGDDLSEYAEFRQRASGYLRQ